MHTETLNSDPVQVTELSPFANDIYLQKYALKREDGTQETWAETAHRVASNVMQALGYDEGSIETLTIEQYINERKFLPGGRYLYASGRPLHQVQNCVLLKAEDTREGWADASHKAMMALMTGAGIGFDYSQLRPNGSIITRTGGLASGPLALMHIINENGRNVMQGGSRRSAIWAGLNWAHADIFDFIRIKDWSPAMRALKENDFTFPMPMELTNISVLLDDEFFLAYENREHRLHPHAVKVYTETVRRMVKTGEPGFSVDVGENAGETLRNACTEVTSADDSDICNLGSINLGRIDSQDEFREVMDAAVLFLLAGTEYSHVPYQKIAETRAKNRRLGLGVMGVHEWLASRGKPYAPDAELGEWLSTYSTSGEVANYYADKHELTRPVKTRAIAPTGTIGIIAETTTGIEPIFCVAYKRRYLDAQQWKYQYVVDPTAKRLIEDGADPCRIEDAYSLSLDVEKRVAFQAWVQGYVDHGISSTINLPYPISDAEEADEFGAMLLRYLPRLRGITAYPNGARGGQPLTAVPYEIAIAEVGVVFEEDESKCVGGICGI